MSLRKCPIGVKNIVEVYSTTILGYRNKFKWYNDKILVFFRCFILYDLTLKNVFFVYYHVLKQKVCSNHQRQQ